MLINLAIKLQVLQYPSTIHKIYGDLPNNKAASDALTANWFSMSFGRKAAKPLISMPSLAPAKFRNKKVGFLRSAAAARGSSCRALKAADLQADSWASDTFVARISSAPGMKEQHMFRKIISYNR